VGLFRPARKSLPMIRRAAALLALGRPPLTIVYAHVPQHRR
jgi:hypothetical protein